MKTHRLEAAAQAAGQALLLQIDAYPREAARLEPLLQGLVDVLDSPYHSGPSRDLALWSTVELIGRAVGDQSWLGEGWVQIGRDARHDMLSTLSGSQADEALRSLLENEPARSLSGEMTLALMACYGLKETLQSSQEAVASLMAASSLVERYIGQPVDAPLVVVPSLLWMRLLGEHAAPLHLRSEGQSLLAIPDDQLDITTLAHELIHTVEPAERSLKAESWWRSGLEGIPAPADTRERHLMLQDVRDGIIGLEHLVDEACVESVALAAVEPQLGPQRNQQPYSAYAEAIAAVLNRSDTEMALEFQLMLPLGAQDRALRLLEQMGIADSRQAARWLLSEEAQIVRQLGAFMRRGEAMDRISTDELAMLLEMELGAVQMAALESPVDAAPLSPLNAPAPVLQLPVQQLSSPPLTRQANGRF